VCFFAVKTEVKMENKTAISIKKFVLPFAIMAGVIRVLIDVIPKLIILKGQYYYGTFLISFIIEAIVITLLILKFKRKNNNTLTLRNALKVGITFMTIVGILFSLSAYIYDTFIDSTYQVNAAIDWAELFNKAEEVRKQQQENPPKGTIIGILSGVVRFSIIGLFISFISGSILKTHNSL